MSRVSGKKIVSFTLILFLVTVINFTYIKPAHASTDVWDGTIATGYASGMGSEFDPYLIRTAEQLAYMASTTVGTDTHVLLMNDIDLNDLEWTPISDFRGIFDGRGHVIRNVKVTDPPGGRAGLFGIIHWPNSHVKNLGVENIDITVDVTNYSSASFVGGFTGYFTDGSIENCYVQNGRILVAANISPSNPEGDTLDNDTHKAYTGGFTGNSSRGVISNCYSQVDVVSKVKHVSASATAGFTGNNAHATRTENCYSAGAVVFHPVTAWSGVGTFSGWANSKEVNCYYDKTLTGDVNKSGNDSSTGLTTAEMQTATPFEGWDTSTWDFTEGQYPTLIPPVYDETAPEFVDNYPVIASLSETSCDITVQPDEDSSLAYVVLSAGSPAPTTTQVLRLEDSAGNYVDSSGVINLTAGSEDTLSITDLTKGQSYQIYMVLYDSAIPMNISASPIIVDFTTPDTDPPQIATGYPLLSELVDRSCQITIEVDEDSTCYFVVLPQTEAAPTAEQVKQALDSWGNSVEVNGEIPLTADTGHSFTVKGLAPDTDYNLYLAVEDLSANKNMTPQPVVISVATAADIYPPIFEMEPGIGSKTDQTSAIEFQVDETGTAYYVLLSDAAPEPNIDQIKNGSDGLDAPGLKNGELAVSDAVSTITLTGLQPETNYDFYLIVEDIQGQATGIKKIDLLTDADQYPPVFTQPPQALDITDTSLKVQFTANEPGTVFYAITNNSGMIPIPTPQQLVEQSQPTFIAAGSYEYDPAGQPEFTVQSLQENQNYRVCLVLRDNQATPNLQSEVTVVEVTTAPDVEEPVLTAGYPKDISALDKSCAFVIRANEAGYGYYVVLENGSNPPDSAQVKQGEIENEVVLNEGNFMFETELEKLIEVGNLSANTEYDIYFVLEDRASTRNLQSEPTLVEVVTQPDITAPLNAASYPHKGAEAETVCSVKTQADEDAVGYYVVLSSNAVVPSAADVKNASSGQLANLVKYGQFDVHKNEETTHIIDELSSATAYYLYLVLEDKADTPNLQSLASEIELITKPPTGDFAAGNGSAANPYQVATVAQLKKLEDENHNNQLNHFALSANLDLSSETNWAPLCNDSGFQGSLAGNGFTVSNLSIIGGSGAAGDYLGLFAKASGAEIDNLNLSNVSITDGRSYIGSLAGETADTIISNVTVSSGVVEGSSFTGGLIGRLNNGTGNVLSKIENCITDLETTCHSSTGGGLVGVVVRDPHSEKQIINCHALGSVKGGIRLGGLVGSNSGAAISLSSASGQVEGSYDIGGLVGISEASITDSQARGDVVGTGRAGGLVGTLKSDSASIKNSYASGQVSGDNAVGGLVGQISGNPSISNCYAQGDVDGQNNIGGLIGYSLYATLHNSYASGNVDGNTSVGGLAGSYLGGEISNVYARGDVTTIDGDNDNIGGLIGKIANTSLQSSFTTTQLQVIDVSDKAVGGLIGDYANTAVISNSYNLIENCAEDCGGYDSETVTAQEINSVSWYEQTLGWDSADWQLAARVTNGEYPLIYQQGTTTLLSEQEQFKLPIDYLAKLKINDISDNAKINAASLVDEQVIISGIIQLENVSNVTISFNGILSQDFSTGVAFDSVTGSYQTAFTRQELIDNELVGEDRYLEIRVVLADGTEVQKRVEGIDIGFSVPEVTDVESGRVYAANSTVTPLFTAESATLNGSPYISGTPVTRSGRYTLVVTDYAGNTNTISFTIAAKADDKDDDKDDEKDLEEDKEIPVNEDAVIDVAGSKHIIGVIELSEDQSEANIQLDEKLLKNVLSSSADKKIELPVVARASTVKGTLTGQMVKEMEQQQVVLNVKTEAVTYTVPASEIQIDDVSKKLGEQVELQDINVEVAISETPVEMIKIVESSAERGTYQLVTPPVNFKVTCTYKDKTVSVDKFKTYVERTIAIPDHVDPAKITTGVIIYPDGTDFHVPTTVYEKDGRYYAIINSLTNSTYSVIWNPKNYQDVAGHWAAAICNEMGARMVVEENSPTAFGPDQVVTRLDYTKTIVAALGLGNRGSLEKFEDITPSQSSFGVVATALEYGLISGYSDNTFRPENYVTRQEAAALTVRAMEFAGLQVAYSAEELQDELQGFTDAEQIGDWARRSAAICAKHELIVGNDLGQFSPTSNITKAELAAIIMRMLQKAKLI